MASHSGKATFDSASYRAFSASTVGKSTDEVYSSRMMNKLLDPKGVRLRESRDSIEFPRSTPLIVGIDVTGSMGIIADVIARKGLGTLFTGVLDRKPIEDPQVMFMAIGDANCDQAPLQVSQFETDVRIIEQLTQIWIEHGGGGNSFESYNLPWYFAARHTEHDSMVKRGKRGYLFTIGDEEAPADLTRAQIKRFVGDDLEVDVSSEEILREAQRSYDVFHIIIEEGSYAKSAMNRTVDSWTKILGQRVIRLADHTKISETIVSAIEVAEGRDAKASASGWGKDSSVIMNAIRDIASGGDRLRLGGAA